VTYGEDKGLELRVSPDFVEYVGHVRALGIEAYVETASDLLVAEAVSEALECLSLAGGDALDNSSGLAFLLARAAR
jgi:hypothetical protein